MNLAYLAPHVQASESGRDAHQHPAGAGAS